MVEPLPLVTENTGLVITRSLVKHKSNAISIEVASFGLDPIKITKGGVVAVLKPVTKVKYFESDNFSFENMEYGTVNKIEWDLPELSEFLKPLVENTSDRLPESEFS